MRTLCLQLWNINRSFRQRRLQRVYESISLVSHYLKRLVFQKKRSTLANSKAVIISHENARKHFEKHTLQKLNELKWDTIQHSLYLDFHSFSSLKNNLSDKNYRSKTTSKTYSNKDHKESKKMASTACRTIVDSC